MASKQKDEITLLKSKFEGQIKIISDIGEFTNVVTFQPNDLDLQCKFQLLGDYPDSTPTIMVRSQSMDTEQTQNMVADLQVMADSRLGTCMLNDLINQGLEFVKEQGLDLSLSDEPKLKSTQKPMKNKKKKAPKSEMEKMPKGKKPPMKTAADVIKRLQWDEAIDKDEFIVGYMDRLTGLEERAFTDFTWEDLASVDQYCLAIPQHRIQYFKYRDEKVWDKNDRLDNVFGSTGGKLTLPEVIQRYHARLERDQLEDGPSNTENEPASNSAIITADLKGMNVNKTDDLEAGIAGGITVQEDKSPSESGSNGRRFNYLVALQLTNKTLVDKLEKIQTEILVQNPDFEQYRIRRRKFHLTLEVMSLKSEKELADCVAVMQKMKHDLIKLTKSADKITFEGIDHFSERVIFAKIKFNRAFLELVDTIKYNLCKADVRSEMKITFKPHMTLFKMDWGEHCARRRLGKHLVLPHVDEVFGHQNVDNISVCAMKTLHGDESDGDDVGFYIKVFEFKLCDFDFEL